MRNVPSLETVYRDYSPRGVKFFYIYKALAHPETNGYVTPYTLEERLLHVAEAERTLGSGFRWICDTMENDLKHALGDAPNSEFIIDPQGRVAVRRAWSNPEQVRRDLERLVGPAPQQTKVSDLDLPRQPPPKIAAKGVVPRLQVPGGMKALRVVPQPSAETYYVKLRAEADGPLLQRGSGQLYLGFRMDPLHHVHWNNLAAPLKYELTLAAGAQADPTTGTGPKVKEEADSDPREFLIDVRQASRQEPLQLTISYFACNDDEGWCKPVTQSYAIFLEPDADGGWVQGRGRSRPGGGGARRPPGGGAPGNLQRMAGMVVRVDAEQRLITVRSRDRGRAQTFVLADDAVVIQDGRRVALDQLQADDRVMLGVDPKKKDEQGRPLVLRLMSRRTRP